MEDKKTPLKQEVADRVIGDIVTYSRATFDRAIPSVYDGLKPVARRVLYAMWENGYAKPGHPLKVIKLTGLTLAYHPHGDEAVNKTIIGMARDNVTVNYALLSPKGMFGTLANIEAASPRYISVESSKFGRDVMLNHIDTDTLDMITGEDFDCKEPAYLPSKIPLVLLNGAYGIAQCYTTGIPQHNLSEIADRCIIYIKNKDISNKELAKGLYPDYVSGGTIINGNELTVMYSGENANVKVRGDVEMDKENDRIIIKTLPLNVDHITIIEQIRKLVFNDDKNTGPKNVALSSVTFVGSRKDKATGESYVFLDCKHGSNLVEIVNNLYKNTRLEESFPVKLTLNESGVIRSCTLKEIIEGWYKINYNIRCRKITLTINKMENKIHVLEGLLQIYSRMDEVINLIKKFSGTKEELTKVLSKTYGLSLIQARSICEMELSRLSRRSENELKKDIADNKEKVRMLADELNRVDELMIRDLLSLKEEYGRPRRTQVIGEINTSGTISISNGSILYTRNSWSVFDLSDILNKRTYMDFKGVKVDEKWIKEMIGFHPVTSDIKSVLVFYSDGTAGAIPIPLVNKWLLDKNCDKHGFIKAICPLYESMEGTVLCVTSDGSLKRFDPKEIKGSKIVNISTIVESCIFIPKSKDNGNLFMLNEFGEYRYYPLSEIRTMGRVAGGVTSGFGDDNNLKMVVVDDNVSHIVVMMENLTGENLCLSIDIQTIAPTSRSTKLRRIVDLHDYEFTGVGSVNLNTKDQLVVFFTRGLVTTCTGRVLKNMKSLRKLSSNPSFGLMDISLN